MTGEPTSFSYDNGTPRNRLGLQDAGALALVERDITTTRLEELHNGSAPDATRSGRFDLDHLKAIHQVHLSGHLRMGRNHPQPRPDD